AAAILGERVALREHAPGELGRPAEIARARVARHRGDREVAPRVGIIDEYPERDRRERAGSRMIADPHLRQIAATLRALGLERIDLGLLDARILHPSVIGESSRTGSRLFPSGSWSPPPARRIARKARELLQLGPQARRRRLLPVCDAAALQALVHVA